MDKEVQEFLKKATPLLNQVYGVDFDAQMEKQAIGGGVIRGLTKLVTKAGPKVWSGVKGIGSQAAHMLTGGKYGNALEIGAAKVNRPVRNTMRYLASNFAKPVLSMTAELPGSAAYNIGKLFHGVHSKGPNFLMRWGKNWANGARNFVRGNIDQPFNALVANGADPKRLAGYGRLARWAGRTAYWGAPIAAGAFSGDDSGENESTLMKIVDAPLTYLTAPGLALEFGPKVMDWGQNYLTKQVIQRGAQPAIQRMVPQVVDSIHDVTHGLLNPEMEYALYQNMRARAVRQLLQLQREYGVDGYTEEQLGNMIDEYARQQQQQQ